MSLNAFSIEAVDETERITDTEYRARVLAKISYTRFTDGEVKIGVFDVIDWNRDTKLAKIMLAEFIRTMKRKTQGESLPRSVEIKLLTSDNNIKEKKESLLVNGFLQVQETGSSREMIFRYEP